MTRSLMIIGALGGEEMSGNIDGFGPIKNRKQKKKRLYSEQNERVRLVRSSTTMVRDHRRSGGVEGWIGMVKEILSEEKEVIVGGDLDKENGKGFMISGGKVLYKVIEKISGKLVEELGALKLILSVGEIRPAYRDEIERGDCGKIRGVRPTSG